MARKEKIGSQGSSSRSQVGLVVWIVHQKIEVGQAARLWTRWTTGPTKQVRIHCLEQVPPRLPQLSHHGMVKCQPCHPTNQNRKDSRVAVSTAAPLDTPMADSHGIL